jgi:hypothetical protein
VHKIFEYLEAFLADHGVASFLVASFPVAYQASYLVASYLVACRAEASCLAYQEEMLVAHQAEETVQLMKNKIKNIYFLFS